ncbi:MAG TPA: 4'-phosphopantetheinyl transferase superfamily protein [Rhodanobacteraceae bacterium]|nr:4'-phosphopantetheinyl transferase superfamily protein [Rhodanobacteraceae bacterium]
MSPALEFVETEAEAAATRLDDASIHLWRLPYASSQGRAPLLALIGAYLGKPASDVALVQDTHGKPKLAEGDGAGTDGQQLEFNWSHSGNYALVALARGLALGVDIELLDKDLRSIEIARRFFDPVEADVVAALAPPARKRAFIGLWCAKEAVLKAAGEGLSFGLARLAFDRRTDTDWSLTRVDPALGHKDDWRLAGFEPAPGYRGALAWRGARRRIAAFRPVA